MNTVITGDQIDYAFFSIGVTIQCTLHYHIKLCNSPSVEDELHFLFECNFYTAQRHKFMLEITKYVPNISYINDKEILKHCMTKPLINLFSKYVNEIFAIRQHSLFVM